MIRPGSRSPQPRARLTKNGLRRSRVPRYAYMLTALAISMLADVPGTRAAEITPPGTHWDTAVLSENGRYALLGHGVDGPLDIWSKAGLRPTRLHGAPVEIGDDGKALVYECGSAVCETEADGRTRRTVVPSRWRPQCPPSKHEARSAPGGRFLLIDCFKPGNSVVLLIDADTGRVVKVFQGYLTGGLAVSADGRTVILTKVTTPWIWHGGVLRKLANGLSNGAYASTNARFITYAHAGEGVEGVAVENTSTGITQIVQHVYSGCTGCFSAAVAGDGSRVLYTDLNSEAAESLYTLDVPSGVRTRLAGGRSALGPILGPMGISADGSTVAYIAVDGRNPESEPSGVFISRLG